jgi:hypothetical protein
MRNSITFPKCSNFVSIQRLMGESMASSMDWLIAKYRETLDTPRLSVSG